MPGLLVGGERRHGVGQHRVVPVLHAGGAGVVGLAGEVEAPPPVRPDLAGQPDGHVAVDEVAALLDVELDEGADAVEVQQAVRRVQPGGADRVGEEDAVAVAQLLRLLPRRGAGDQPRAEAGAPEPRPLLLDEDADADRAVRLEAPGPQRVDGGERGRHAQRAVVRTTVEDRVEVRAGEHALVARARAGGGLPPGDLVADAVGLDDQPARRALLGEPRPQLRLRRRPGLAEVAARGRRSADRCQVAPHLLEVGRRGHAPSPPGSPIAGQRTRPGMSSRIPDDAARWARLAAVTPGYCLYPLGCSGVGTRSNPALQRQGEPAGG